MKVYIAEALGTATLTLMVGLSLAGTFPIPTPLLAALTLGLFVYSIGHLSGAHINPAVTIGAWSIGKIDNKEAMSYLVAQMLGAFVAMMLLTKTAMMPDLTINDSMMVGWAELLGTFLFTFGVASVVYGRTPGSLGGVVVGGSLLLGIAAAALMGASGLLNPAVAFGVDSFSLMYVLGPIAGSILGMQAYKYLQN